MSIKARNIIINDLIEKSGELKKLADKLAYELFELYKNGDTDEHKKQEYEEISYQMMRCNERIASLSM